MNKRLIIGLTLSAWCLYLASIFLPAADVSWNSANGIPKGGDLEQEWEVLQCCVYPFYWIVVYAAGANAVGLYYVEKLIGCRILVGA